MNKCLFFKNNIAKRLINLKFQTDSCGLFKSTSCEFTGFKFNLLPWRETEKIAEYTRHCQFCIFICGFLFFVLVSYQYCLTHKVDKMVRNNLLLMQTTGLLEQKLANLKYLKQEQKKLFTEIIFLQKLQYSNQQISNFAVEISKLLPRNIILDTIKIDGKDVQIQGEAANQKAITNFISNLEYAIYVKNPEIISIVKNDSQSNTEQLKQNIFAIKLIINE